MSNNNLPPQPQEEEELTPHEIRTLLSEAHDFKKTSLYAHYKNHHKNLYDATVAQIINEPIKGPETLYSREGWIGEARAAELQTVWFDELYAVLTQKLRELD